MILVILLVAILFLVFSICVDEFKSIATVFISIVFSVTVILTIETSGLRIIDDKISMYQEENTKIEMQISALVDEYKEYESNTFANLTSESSMMLATLYPELESNELVQSQMTIYVQNNEKIKELREQKISGSVLRWWLYFGK